ncbi:MAG: exodeoxyribonuclease V subunit gamma [Planctomycetes bacterium]|nr:exodeoxyribonuclease V subunit gamma [Planctomycetota bacterium]
MLHVSCSDAFALERAFLARLADACARRSSPLAPITVVAPTARLLRALQRAAARELGALAGVSFLVHRGLALALLERAEPSPPELLGSALWEAAAEAALRAGSGALAQTAERFDSTAGALASTLRDLRDARVAPADLRGLGALAEEVGNSLAHVESRLRSFESERLVDAAGLMECAIAVAPTRAAQLGTVIHVGALDVTESVRALLQAVNTSGRLEIVALEPDEKSLFAGATKIAAAVRFVEAPDLPAELDLAARTALVWYSQGVPLEEIGIVARSLEPYADLLESTCRRHGLSWTSSAAVPALRRPTVQALVDAVECAAEGYRRPAVMRLLRSPSLRTEFLGFRSESWNADAFDRLSRELSLEGEPAWTTELAALEAPPDPAWPHERRRAAEFRGAIARDLRSAMERLVQSLEPLRSATSWSRFAEGALRLESELFVAPTAPQDARAREEAAAALAEIGQLDGLLPYPGIEAAAARMRRVLARVREPLARGDRGGVRFLDLQQSRGVHFRRLLWLGLHEGGFPREPREDPILSDALRAELAHKTGRRVPIPGDTEASERLLAAMALTSASEEVVVSWQRNDERGRPRNPSPFLRELARAVGAEVGRFGRPAETRTIPAHPADQALEVARTEKLLAPSTAIAASALLSAERVEGARSAAAALSMLEAGFLEGFQQIECVDSFRIRGDRGMRFDGVAAPAELRALAPTALEELGRCPLKFFFRHRLGIRALEEPEDGEVLDAPALGRAVHRTLEGTYDDELLHLARTDCRAAIAQAKERIARTLQVSLAEEAPGRGRRQRGLLAALGRRWEKALGQFVAEDLERLAAAGADEVRCEEPRTATLRLREEILQIDARFDRIAKSRLGLWISDYKTGRGRIEDLASPTQIARGRQLQLMIYGLVARASGAPIARIEALRIHPDLDAVDRKGAAAIEGLRFAELESPVVSALAVLVRLARAGHYPITLEEEPCVSCDFRPACRRAHAPTRQRHSVFEAASAYYALGDVEVKVTRSAPVRKSKS